MTTQTRPTPKWSETETTCGEACWEAREDICRCSCRGKNHGILRTPDGQRPERTAKIDGDRYVLIAVGTDGIYKQAEAINEANGPYEVHKISETLTYKYWYRDTDKHAPARVKCPTKDQLARWPELAPWRDRDMLEAYRNPVSLLWRKSN